MNGEGTVYVESAQWWAVALYCALFVLGAIVFVMAAIVVEFWHWSIGLMK